MEYIKSMTTIILLTLVCLVIVGTGVEYMSPDEPRHKLEYLFVRFFGFAKFLMPVNPTNILPMGIIGDLSDGSKSQNLSTALRWKHLYLG